MSGLVPSIMRPVSSLLVLAFLSTGSAFAHSPPDPSLVGNITRLTQESAFVFRGEAVNVEYRNLNSGMGPIPHTFVTYRVDQVIAGSPKKFVTLRFVGGHDGMGGFLEATGVPLFQAGDEDILFVANNGVDTTQDSPCALVGCEFGRYRIVDGAVYEAHGSPVTSIGDGRIVTGGTGPAKVLERRFPAPKFDDMLKKPGFVARLKSLGLSVAKARAMYEAEAPSTVSIGVEQSALPAGGAVGRGNSTLGTSSLSADDITPKIGLSSDLVVNSLLRQIKTLKAGDASRSMSSANSFRDAKVTDQVSLSNEAAKPPGNAPAGKLLPPIRK